jgi:sarcosine oxidase subunit beta
VTEIADLVIIGGGITGVSIAFRAAQRRAGKIVLLEASTLASAGTGLSTGVVRQFYLIPELAQMAREGIEWYRRFADFVDGEDAGFVNTGMVVGATAEQKALFSKGVQLQVGSQSRILNASELRDLVPNVVTEGFDCAYYEPEAGYADPGRACLALATAARARGVDIRRDCPAIGIVRDGQGVSKVVTKAGDISTRVVVNAAGPWAAKLASWVQVPVALRCTRHKVIMIERPRPIAPDHPIFSDAVNLFYMRPDSTNRILIGSTSRADSREEVDPDSYLRSASLEEIADLGDRANQRIPALSHSGLIANWCGIYDESLDGFPVLGQSPDVRGFYVATGLSGHGFKLAPAISRLMVAAIIDGQIEPALHLLRLGRFTAGDFIDSPTTTTLTSMRAVDHID